MTSHCQMCDGARVGSNGPTAPTYHNTRGDDRERCMIGEVELRQSVSTGMWSGSRLERPTLRIIWGLTNNLAEGSLPQAFKTPCNTLRKNPPLNTTTGKLSHALSRRAGRTRRISSPCRTRIRQVQHSRTSARWPRAPAPTARSFSSSIPERRSIRPTRLPRRSRAPRSGSFKGPVGTLMHYSIGLKWDSGGVKVVSTQPRSLEPGVWCLWAEARGDLSFAAVPYAEGFTGLNPCAPHPIPSLLLRNSPARSRSPTPQCIFLYHQRQDQKRWPARLCLRLGHL